MDCATWNLLYLECSVIVILSVNLFQLQKYKKNANNERIIAKSVSKT